MAMDWLTPDRHAIAAAVAVVVFALPVRAQDGAKDILTNGGFEQGAAGWTLDEGHRLVRDEALAHSGAACVHGRVTKPSQSLTLRRKVRVSAGNTYRFQIWARATNKTKLVLWVVQPGAKARGLVTAFEKLRPKWKHYSIALPVDRAGNLELQVIAPSSWGAPAGEIWIDDIALLEDRLPEVEQVSDDTEFCDDPSLVRGGDGAFYVAYNGFSGGVDVLRVARYGRGNGGALTRETAWSVPTKPGSFLLDAKLVATAAGAALLYAVERNELDWDIALSDVTATGPSEPLALDVGDGIDVKPVAVRHGEALWVAWESNAGEARQIRLTSVRGGKRGRIETVSTAGLMSYGPSVAVLPNGEVCVAWHAFREGNYDVYLRRRAPDGAWTAEQRLTRAPNVDRHPVLFTRRSELWVAYEHALVRGYNITKTDARRCIIARIEPDGRLLAPVALAKSVLSRRTEAPAPVFDEACRLWVAHLRPRLPRAGWDAYLMAFTGNRSQPIGRAAAAKGMDRRPGIVLDGNRAVIAGQMDDLPETWSTKAHTPKAKSRIFLADIELPAAPTAPAPIELAPLVEPDAVCDAIQLRRERGEERATPEISYRGRTLKLFYGDLHEHSNVSVCNRVGDQTIDESYQHMRDIVNLDFACVTDHGYNINPYLWNFTAKQARVNNDPGRFLTFLGEEWTSSFEKYSNKHPYGYYGHRNLIFADAYLPRWWNAENKQTPAEVWRDLRAMNASFVQIPHQIADTGNVPCDWDFVDEEAQPVAEIFQVRGSYEYKGTPREAKRSTPQGYFLQDAWAKGIVIGVIASPDHGGGYGKACVYAPELTREAILDGMRARHCFGTTAARVFLDVRVNGHPMGEKIPGPDGKPVRVSIVAECPADIERVEVCRNNEFVYLLAPEARTVNTVFEDTAPLTGPSYYYVRIIQTDGEITWSSPVWLESRQVKP